MYSKDCRSYTIFSLLEDFQETKRRVNDSVSKTIHGTSTAKIVSKDKVWQKRCHGQTSRGNCWQGCRMVEDSRWTIDWLCVASEFCSSDQSGFSCSILGVITWAGVDISSYQLN